MLVVRCCREVNELRYVLCPKRMPDAHFWQIYFLLAKGLLPEEAFDPGYKLPASSAAGLTLTDLQARAPCLAPFCSAGHACMHACTQDLHARAMQCSHLAAHAGRSSGVGLPAWHASMQLS